MVFQDFDLDRRGRVKEPQPVFRMWGREGNLVTVNGQAEQSLTLPQGGLVRATAAECFSFSHLSSCACRTTPGTVAATDGIALTAPVERQEVVLAPGERVDLLILGNQQPGR